MVMNYFGVNVMTKMNILSAFLLGGTFLFSACTSGPYVPKAYPDSPEVAGARVVFLDKDLLRTTAVDHPGVLVRNGNHRLVLQLPIRNRRNDETIQIQVQTLFKNAAGQVLYSEPGSEAAWQTIVLSANQLTTYTRTALTSEAVDYTVRIRYAQRPE
jgi:hypothetical protein